MPSLRCHWLLFLFLLFVYSGSAQVFQPGQTKLFKTFSDTIVLDTLSLVPGTLQFKMFPYDSASAPEINYRLHAIIFKNKRPDSIVVQYKRFPFNFERNYFHKDQNDLYTDL